MSGDAVVHPYGEHPEQFGQLTRPAGRSRGTVVLIHGGFWRQPYGIENQYDSAAALAARGWTVWNIEYRRVGGSGGYPETLLDVAAALDHLAHLDVDLAAVTTVGHSAGGHLAVWAAARDLLPADAPGSAPVVRVTRAISQAGAVDLVTGAAERMGNSAVLEFLGGEPDALPERYAIADPTLLAPLHVPVVCVHSPEHVVPLAQSERFVQVTTDAGGEATLIRVGGSHDDHRVPGSEAWLAMADALDG